MSVEQLDYVNICQNADGSVYDTGLHGNPVASARPVPKPRPAPVPRRPPRQSSLVEEKNNVTPAPRPRPKPRQSVDAAVDNHPLYRTSLDDSVDNLPIYRKNIEELIKLNRPQKEKFEAACSVLKIQCSLNTKYEIVDLLDILQKNKDKDVRKIPQAFTVLEKYANMLLKEESQRHPSWRSVQFSSAAYQNKVKFMVDAIYILKNLGYTEDIYNNNNEIIGVTFPSTSATNASMVIKIAVDLVIAQFEVEAMLMGEHPRSQTLQTMEDVPDIYFPQRQLVQDITTDEALFDLSNNTVMKKPVDYALNKSSVKIAESIYDIPPPIPPKKNVPNPSPIINDYKIQVSTLRKGNEIPNETPEYVQLIAFEQQNVSRELPLSNGPILPGAMQGSEQVPAIKGMTCVNCGVVGRPNSKFCSDCGSPLKKIITSESLETSKITEEMKMASISDEDAFEDADEGWNCEHCTFVNSHETNICSVCDRTSTISRGKKFISPPDKMINERQVQGHFEYAGANPVRSAEEKQSPSLIHETQQQENLDKFAGANQFHTMVDKRTSAPIGLTDAVIAGNFTTVGPKQLRKSPSGTLLDEGKLREARKSVEDLQMKKLKEQQETEARKQKLIQEQNNMRENAQKLVALLMFSESHGYTAEECILAQKYNNNLNNHLLLNWLRNDWLKLIDEVVFLCMQCFGNDDTVGPISKEEAKQLLLQVDGEKDDIPQLFSERRKVQINKVATLVNGIERKDIIKALFEAGGDDEKALQNLYTKQLQLFHESIQKKSSPTDFDRLKDPNVPEEVRRRMVMLLTGVSWGRSAFIFRLMNDGVEASVEELLQVIGENVQYTYDECRKFFQHTCLTCYGEFSHNTIRVGLHCSCELCLECYSNHINTVISQKHIRNLVCPICFKPDIEDPSFETQMYYAMISTEIKHLIEKDWLKENIREIFDNNLLDFHLKKHENFRYCINCKNGFLWENINQIRMQCNQCNARMCFLCKEKWMDQHDDTSCEDFKAWKEANDPERQALGVQALLQGREIECPDCKARFELAEGGCMHFICIECRYEFCCGCNKGFKREGQCQVDVSCQGKGMHTHHPRDCLYYIRDMEVKDLETLLTNHQVQWEKDYPPGMEDYEKVCGVALQKDTEDGGRKDEPCGEAAPDKMAGLCEKHYKEYLVVLVNNNGIDPIEVMDINDMRNELRRNFKEALPKNNGESDDQFKQRLTTHLLKELPLQVRAGRRNAPVVGGQVVGADAAPPAAAAAAAAPAPAAPAAPAAPVPPPEAAVANE